MAAGLRAAGHHVILACRSLERCASAKAELDGRGLPASCECRRLDLCDAASIRAFAAGLRTPLATLVNNAGVMGVPDHWGPNHSGPYLLTRLCLPSMAPRGRIVTVASEAHRRGRLLITPGAAGQLQVEGEPGRWWYAGYARSKLANVLMTAHLQRQLQQRRSSVTACSVSPGRVNTHIFANLPGWLQPPLRWLAAAAFQTPEQGARTVLHAALAPELAGRQELYLHDSRPCAAAPAARDPALAADLWQLSNQQAGLSAAEDAAMWPPH